MPFKSNSIRNLVEFNKKSGKNSVKIEKKCLIGNYKKNTVEFHHNIKLEL